MIFGTVLHRLMLRSINESCFPSGPFQLYNMPYPFMPEIVLIVGSTFVSMTKRAISVFVDEKKHLYLEKSTFINVSSPENYGAIYYCHKGHTFLTFVCAFRCFTQSSTGSFQFAYLSADLSTNITFFMTSISECPGISGSRNHPLLLNNGFLEVCGLNLSAIKGILNHGSITAYPTEVSRVAFSNIAKIEISNMYSLYYSSNHLKSNYFHNINFVANLLPIFDYYLIYINGTSNTIFERSVFTNNIGWLFCFSTTGMGSLVVVDSFVSHSSSYYLSWGSRVFISSYKIHTGSATPSLILEHLHTALCIAQQPYNVSKYYDLLSPECIPPTPPQTMPNLASYCNAVAQNIQFIPLFASFIYIFSE